MELFAKGEGNVALLLGLLGQEDFYVRYHIVQLLTALAVGGSFRLQQVIRPVHSRMSSNPAYVTLNRTCAFAERHCRHVTSSVVSLMQSQIVKLL